jgi:DNA-binding beta-propeller fold protein YncE
MTMDASGNLYVTEYGSNRVQVFDPAYNYLTEWPSSGASGIAVDDDEVYVADWNSSVINVYDHAGTLLRSFGSYDQLGTPSNMAFAPDGSLLVGDAGGRVTRWDPDGGSLMEVVAAYGDGPGQVWNVWAISTCPTSTTTRCRGTRGTTRPRS